VKLTGDEPGGSDSRNLVGGRPIWSLTNTPATRYSPLSSDTSCDAAVIGAGVSGALAALLLVDAGLDVVVVDRHEVAGGSTSANTALLLYDCDVPLHQLAERMGETDAAEVYRLCRDALIRLAAVASRLDQPACFAPRPSLYLASRPDDVPALRREHEIRRRHGFAVDLLERTDVESRFGFPNLAALLSHDAAELDPVSFCRQLLVDAGGRGARIHERTAITDVRCDDDRIELTTAGGRRINARHAILATGYQSERYLGRQVARGNSTYAVATKPLRELPRWPDRALIWETAHPYLYLRTTPDNRILIGGLDEPDVDAERRDALLEAKSLRLVERLRGMFPAVDPRVEAAWCGTFLNTDDSLPYIGTHPEAPRLHFALCYGGNGTTFSLVAAELLRDALLGRVRTEARLFDVGRRMRAPRRR
jgi:glycine/D-amino acid oxidase-like deaminating enzyme